MEPARDSDRSAAAVGYALAAAAVAIMLGYFPSLSSPFVAPKLAVLLVAGACGFLGWAAKSGEPRPAPGKRGDDGASVRAIDRTSDRTIVGVCAAFGLVVVLSTVLAVGRGTPGAPYAAIEIIRIGAMFGVAVGAAFAARAMPATRAASARRFTPAPVWSP